MKCQGGRVWGNHGMDWYPVKGEIVVILLVASFEETRIIGTGPGLQATAPMQTLPNYLQPLSLNNLNCCHYKLYELAAQR